MGRAIDDEALRSAEHEINNLLGIILNYAHFVDEAVSQAQMLGDGDDWQSVRADVAEVVKAGERAAEVMRELRAALQRPPA